MAIRSALLLLLSLLVGGCVDTPGEPRAPGAPGSVALAGEAFTLQRYPVVDLRVDLGESLIEGEEALVRRSMRAVEDVIRQRARDPGNVGRGDHAKPLGCYRAGFTVSPPGTVRADDRAGIAGPENLGRTFEAVVRLSNSEPKDVPDLRSATTGLAIKVALDPAGLARDDLLPGGGAEQDFVAGGLERFVSRSIVEYAELFELRIHPFRNALRIRSRHPDAFTVFGAEPLLRSLRLTAAAVPLVLEQRFSSLLPYAWGAAAVKYRFEPCHAFDRRTARFSRFDAGYQAKVLTEFLRSNDVCYVMKVQARPRAGSEDERRVIAAAFPIEDATVSWPEPGAEAGRVSAAFQEVARVRIKAGSSALAEPACERLAFNPWNGLKAHQPLGSLNRARLAVYRRSESVRTEIGQ
jgi:hypothetical protein